jgi:F420-dependent oxidoreductase-like protein
MLKEDLMKIGLQIPDFTWPGGPATLGADLARVASSAEAAGFDSISVMDHFFQIEMVGAADQEMLECYTTLAFLAAHTHRVKLMGMVTGTPYRHPGVLAKTVTTLDVLSGGRAWLGIGAGWFEAEARGLGIPFPALGERFERLEETLRICLQMWAGDQTPFRGKHYQLDRLLNVPSSLQRPHPPILIGGSGERKTLRLVARYGDACNLFPSPDMPRKLEVLREHCRAEGRDYDSIEKTCIFQFDLGPDGGGAENLIEQLRSFAGMGIQTVIGSVKNVASIAPLEAMGRLVIPAAAAF